MAISDHSISKCLTGVRLMQSETPETRGLSLNPRLNVFGYRGNRRYWIMAAAAVAVCSSGNGGVSTRKRYPAAWCLKVLSSLPSKMTWWKVWYFFIYTTDGNAGLLVIPTLFMGCALERVMRTSFQVPPNFLCSPSLTQFSSSVVLFRAHLLSYKTMILCSDLCMLEWQCHLGWKRCLRA